MRAPKSQRERLPHPHLFHNVQQPLAARLYIDHLLRRIDAQYSWVFGADEDLILDSDAEIVELLGEVGVGRDKDAGLDGLCGRRSAAGKSEQRRYAL